MSALLASVMSISEAWTALECGADIIDLKDARHGALAALPAAQVRAIRAAVGERALVSATTGDLTEPWPRQQACAQEWRAIGVDVIKMACPTTLDVARTRIEFMGRLAAGGAALVAVLAADAGLPDDDLLLALAGAGVRGVMLDTTDKRIGLRDWLPHAALAQFVADARNFGLAVGLAGGLTRADVTPLLALQPDYLGFRGALCRGAARGGAIDPSAVRAIRTLVPAIRDRAALRLSIRADGGPAYEVA
jgi:dihydroneopterin aldolase